MITEKTIKIRYFALAASLLFISHMLHAQMTREEFNKYRQEQKEEFSNYVQEMRDEFNSFRDSINTEFAKFMRKSWEEFRAFQGIPVPQLPEPEKPPIADPEKKPTSQPLPFDKVIPLPVPTPRPEPIAPIIPQSVPETPKIPEVPTFSFLFYNTDCKVNLDNTLRFSLPDASENNIAQTWEVLSDNKNDALINDCLNLRDKLNLSDWGYLQMLKTLSEKFLGRESNETVLLQMFILTQSGYKVRIARSENQLVLLVPFQEIIYEYSFININGIKYYVVNKNMRGQLFNIFNYEFPKEQYFSWRTEQPQLAVKLSFPKTFCSQHYPEINVSVQTNLNLIDYYNGYPQTSQWNLYALAGLSKTVKQTLYPAIQRAIADKTKIQAAGMLLDFMHTAFAYQIDDQQFGYERSFFADENFFYPYNDCEDRSILYALLVKDLLNLEVVLLHYPGHLATAVHFPEDVNGDYFNLEGKKFVVCDPTYIGARIGMTMDQFKNTNAEIIKI